MDCSGAVLDNPGKTALEMSRTVVKGAFFLRREARVNGMLTLTGASIGTIHDEASSWPKTGDLLLNRCRYGAFIDSPVDAESRLDWLARQTPERFGEDFWPQPYEQLASVFREMGHGEDARAVLVVKERLQRQARRARAGNPLWRALLAAADGVLGVTLAYGRQPLLALVWLLLFWLVGVVVFAHAEHQGAVMPNSAVVLRAPEWTLCGLATSRTALTPRHPTDERARRRRADAAGLLPSALGGVELPGLQCLDVLARYAAAGTRDGAKGVLAAQPGQAKRWNCGQLFLFSVDHRLGSEPARRRRLFRIGEVVMTSPDRLAAGTRTT